MTRKSMMIRLIGTMMVWRALALSSQPVVASQQDLAFEMPTVQQTSFLCRQGESDWTVVCFLGTECPLARLYAPRLQRLADEFSSKSVRFVGVYSNRQDSNSDIERFVREHRVRFACGKDEGNRLADRFQARRTPEVFVLDAQLSIRYRGRIDDQYSPGTARTEPGRRDLFEALVALTSGQDVAVSVTEPNGCLIGRVKQPQSDSDVTFSGQVAAILNRHCVECHREGEIGPFALTDYYEVVGWAEMIQEVIDDQRMPPWHASADSVPLANSRGLSTEEKEIIRRWVNAGAPLGDPTELPPPPSFVTGWQLPREPDLVLSMRNRPFLVPPDGTVEYQYFVVDPGFTQDRWVAAAQAVPGNPAVVHHCIVFVRPPDGEPFRGVGWVTAYVPGQRIPDPLPGHARRIPAGSKLVFQMHYTPNGETHEDLSKVGLVFVDESEVTDELITLAGIDQEFEIPAFQQHQVEGSVGWFPEHGTLLSVMPHMHLRGRSFELSVRQAGHELDRRLLSVPRYDFNWQHVYHFSQPLPLADVADLNFKMVFDNTRANPVNPNPSETVTWGDQTWEEMAVVFFDVAEPRNANSSQPGEESRDKLVEASHVTQRTAEFVADFFDRFDQDTDGIVQRHETPLAFRRFGFHRFDHDGDQQLTPDEVRRAARLRFQRDGDG